MSELFSLLEQWSRLEPDRCRNKGGVFQISSDDGGVYTTWNQKFASDIEKTRIELEETRIEQVCREAIRARGLEIHSIEAPFPDAYKYWVALAGCTGGFTERSVEALLSSYLLYLQRTLAPDREEPCQTYTAS